MPRDNAYLQDILESARAIQRYLSSITREEFQANMEKQDAVVRRYAIIGEAARHLSPAVQKDLPEIPWRLVMVMRNIVIHDYDDVDADILWDTAQDDLPQLINRLEAYLAEHPPSAE